MSNTDIKWPILYPTTMVAHTLPATATKALQEAALLDTRSPVGESILRIRALDAVTARIKLAYPKLFIQEDIALTPRYTVPSFMDRSHK